jgi:diguanylate cyclase (GGDEF)-like protein
MPLTQSAQVNRTDHAAFLAVLSDLLVSGSRSDPLALLLVQIRHFTRLNTRLGYGAGDDVLFGVAEKLATGLGDHIHVMRIGASKFAVVLRDLKNANHSLLAAKKIERLAGIPIEVDGAEITVDLVQGISVFPEHASSADRLLQCAENALASAIAARKPIALYSPAQIEEIGRSEQIEAALSRSLRNGNIEPYFQQQVRLSNGSHWGAEALLRCRDEIMGFISPELLIDVAERTGRLGQVTSVILNAALRSAAQWPRGPSGNRLSVNVSAQSLKDPELIDTVRSAIKVWGTIPEELTIEVTESALMDNPERSFETLRHLRDLGIRVAIDDFGTGYSSLSYFKNIPANELKVDKSFVFNMLKDSADRKIVETVINLAHSFGLETVAEGVKNEETFELLREMGCDLAQGYWIGKPMSAAEFLRLLG